MTDIADRIAEDRERTYSIRLRATQTDPYGRAHVRRMLDVVEAGLRLTEMTGPSDYGSLLMALEDALDAYAAAGDTEPPA